MQKNHQQFVKLLQSKAQSQSRLQKNPFIPKWIAPLPAAIAIHPWQTLLLTSFIFSWLVFLIWFEFFYNLVQNIS